jgi:hypothetical protein
VEGRPVGTSTPRGECHCAVRPPCAALDPRSHRRRSRTRPTPLRSACRIPATGPPSCSGCATASSAGRLGGCGGSPYSARPPRCRDAKLVHLRTSGRSNRSGRRARIELPDPGLGGFFFGHLVNLGVQRVAVLRACMRGRIVGIGNELRRAGALVVGAVLAEAGDAAIDNARIDLAQALIIDAKLCLDVGPEFSTTTSAFAARRLNTSSPWGL